MGKLAATQQRGLTRPTKSPPGVGRRSGIFQNIGSSPLASVFQNTGPVPKRLLRLCRLRRESLASPEHRHTRASAWARSNQKHDSQPRLLLVTTEPKKNPVPAAISRNNRRGGKSRFQSHLRIKIEPVRDDSPKMPLKSSKEILFFIQRRSLATGGDFGSRIVVFCLSIVVFCLPPCILNL